MHMLVNAKKVTLYDKRDEPVTVIALAKVANLPIDFGKSQTLENY